MRLTGKLGWRLRLISSKFTGHEALMPWLETLKVCLRMKRFFQPHAIKVLDEQGDFLLIRMPDGKELFFPKGQPLEIPGLIYNERSELYPVVVEPDDWVIQVGAAEGYFALSVIEKAAKVYLIEPLPNWQQGLRRTFSDALKRGKAEMLPHALGEKEEKATFYMPDKWLAGSSIYKDWAQRQGVNVEAGVEVHKLTVDVKPLDMIVAEKTIERVDFIKADIEGAELAMLRGACETLK